MVCMSAATDVHDDRCGQLLVSLQLLVLTAFNGECSCLVLLEIANGCLLEARLYI
jgi:hypothetical protein